jgi:hypothetical protein
MTIDALLPPRAPRKRVRAVAEAIAAELHREFPQLISTAVSFKTREGEDAYLWLRIPVGDQELKRRLLEAAAKKTAAYLLEGIAILPQFTVVRARDAEHAQQPAAG